MRILDDVLALQLVDNIRDGIDVEHLLNDEIVTEFSHTSMLNFEIGKDVQIHNYFRVRFPQQNLI